VADRRAWPGRGPGAGHGSQEDFGPPDSSWLDGERF